MKLKIFLILLCTVFTSPVFASAAERQESIYDAAMKSRNGIGVSNVRAANDMINADITQRVTVDGSNATINTKVSIPANDDSFARKTASHAKNLLRGGAYAAGAAAAMKVILDGVDYVLDPKNNSIQKPNPEYTTPNEVEPYHQYRWSAYVGSNIYYKASSQAFLSEWTDYYKSADPNVINIVSTPCTVSGIVCSQYNVVRQNGTTTTLRAIREANPSYNPLVTNPVSPTVPATDSQIEDAFFNWFKNNPGSVTDPVTTYIYSPKDSQGNALPKSPEGKDPSFGPNEITDEMMNNYMEHRNANLQNPYTTTIGDSTQTDTTQNPDGSKTTTTTNPDGSKTTTRTDTKTDPDTGEVTTTVTETTTMPDGSTSTKNETSTQTKPKPETTDLPAFCDYAASLCTWMNRDTEHKADEKSLWQKITEWFDWTKEEPDQKDEDTKVDVSEMDIPDVKTNLFNASGQCPPDFSYPFPLPTGGTYNITYSYLGVCEWFAKLYYINVTCGWIAAYMIVVGRGEKKNG